VLLPAAAGVGRRVELADQSQLLERGLELGAQDAPLDPLEGEQRGLDRRPLAFASEVGAKAGTDVAGAADVEHLTVAVAKEVDAGPGGGTLRKGALAVDPSFSRRCERPQLGETPRSQFLGQPDQVHQHLRRGLRIGKGAVTGSGRNPEEVGERGETDPA
jgi:hypothetical protein